MNQDNVFKEINEMPEYETIADAISALELTHGKSEG